MILTALAIGGVLFAAFLALVIGIRGTERHRSLCNPNGDAFARAFARRVLGVYVRQVDDHEHDQDHEDRYGQVRR